MSDIHDISNLKQDVSEFFERLKTGDPVKSEAESDEEETYPGSSQSRRDPSESSETPRKNSEDPLESFKPRIMKLKGKDTEFFTIQALADALNRSTITIRKWETKGWLPTAQYRSPGEKQDRLYTREQIEGILRIAREEGLMNPQRKPRVDKTNFPQRASELFGH